MSEANEAPDLDQTARAVSDTPRSDPLLESLVGRPREEPRVHGAGADAVKLVNLVDSAVVNSSPPVFYVGSVKDSKGKKHRGHRRVDWVNTIIGAVAVVVVAATAVFAGVQVASADPAADAIEVLAADEASLTGAEKSLVTSTTALEETITNQLADAALIRNALNELSATDERAETADPTALGAAVQAVDAYRSGLEQAVVPTPPPAYERGSVDEDSLASVADAIDRVQEASSALDAASDELRAARTAMDTLTTTYTGQLATFANSLTAYAAAENEAYPVAGQEFRDAVSAAAASVTGTPLNGAPGAAALIAFRDAVLALRDEDRRVREIEQMEREQSQNNNWPPVQETPPPDSETTDPGTDTTDPGTAPGGAGPVDDGETPQI